MDRYLPRRMGVPADTRALLAALRDGRTDPKVVADVARFIANRDGAARDERHAVNGAFRDAFVEERIARAFSCAPGGGCLDLLLYPSVRDVAADAERGPDTGGTHRLAAYSGRPAIAFPIGAVRTAGGVRPVSVELMGRPGSDAMLMTIVEAWQARLDLPRAHGCADGEAAICLDAATAP
jgi:amidase